MTNRVHNRTKHGKIKALQIKGKTITLSASKVNTYTSEHSLRYLRLLSPLVLGCITLCWINAIKSVNKVKSAAFLKWKKFINPKVEHVTRCRATLNSLLSPANAQCQSEMLCFPRGFYCFSMSKAD